MKNNFLKVLAVFAIFSVILTTSIFVFADEPEELLDTAMNTTDSEYKLIDNDYFAAEDNVEMKRLEVEGNVFVFGKDVEIEDVVVDGSLFVAGQNVELKNVSAKGDIFAAGQTVKLENTQVKNIFGAGQAVKLLDETQILRDAYLAGQNVTVDASMDTLSVGANALTIGSSAVINSVDGELSNQAEISENAKIESNNIKVVDVEETKEVTKVPSVLDKVLEIVGKMIRTIILSLVVAFIVVKCNKADRIKNYTGSKIAVNGAIGLGLSVGLILAAVMLLFTIIFTIIGIIGIFAYVSMLLCATAAGSVVVALKLIGNKEANMKNVLLYTVLVAACLVVVSMIPVIGGIVKLLIALVGMGTLFDIIFIKDKKDEKAEVVNVAE